MRKTCLNMVYELARKDPRVLFIGSDLGPGTLDRFRQEMPDRFFMEGVYEGHVVGMAAGLAMEGFIPYVNTIASFLTRRCFEQVVLDLCWQNLPVRLIGNGGGLVYAPLGLTHMAIEDIAIFRALPNMTVVVPSDAEEMRRFMERSIDLPGPVYIRLGKGGDPVISRDENGFTIGRGILLKEPGRVLFITTGVMTGRVLQSTDILDGQGITAGVLHVHTVKPLDEDQIACLGERVEAVVTVEEHVLMGGLGSAVGELLIDRGGRVPKMLRLGLPDRFPERYGRQDDLLEFYGLQPEPIARSVSDFMAR